MRVIIAGSRTIRDYEIVEQAVRASGFIITQVLSGRAVGVDRLGEFWAEYNDIPCFLFPAEWDKYGKSAGYRRNEEMADRADALIAVWDGRSRGTQHMIDIATQKGLRVFVCNELTGLAGYR